MRGAAGVALLCLVAAGCDSGGEAERPTSTSVPSTTVAPTTVTKVPKLTAEPIPGLETATFHLELERLGFARSSSGGPSGFVTTTSKRPDATVSTYGAGGADVVKIVAEADGAAASEVLGAVARAAITGADARRAESWVKVELGKEARSPTQPRTARATFGRQPYELLVNPATTTLSIGRLTS